MKHSYFTPPGSTFRLQPLSTTSALFLLFFLLNFSFGFGQEVPVYDWEKAEPMGQANASNLDQIVIATATDTEDNIYALKFGGEVVIFDRSGDPSGSFRLEGSFEGLVDMAINSRNEIYVSHYEGREVLAFDLNGNELTNKRKDSEYFKPLGLAFDKSDNLYVLDYNDGTGAEDDISSRLKIYYANGTVSSNLLTNELDQPYRIAVATSGDIYISHAANNGETLVFDENFNFLQRMPNLGSPGSIEIDEKGFIHIIDYSDKVDFARILERDVVYLLGAIGDIRDGINDNEFSIKLFNSNNIFEKAIRDKIQLPLDLTFTYCTSKMAVDNANVEGGFLSTRLVFDLEIYNRTPSFETEKPVAVCESGLEFTLENGEVTIIAEEIDGGSIDNCEIASLELSQYTFEEEGDFPVTLTVTDISGNVDTCETTITILPGDEVEQSVTCPGDSVLDGLELGENCSYILPEMGQYIGIENFQSEEFSVVDENINDNILTVEIEVLDDEELIETCELRFELIDETPPVITCPDDITREIPAGEDSIIINYDLPEVSDNCSENLTPELIDGLASGSEFEAGVHTIKFEVTDNANLTTSCEFTITLTQEQPEPYDFQCVEEYTVRLGEDDQISGVTEIPTSEFVTSDTSNLEFELAIQQFTCDNIGTNSRTINATNTETGEEYSCSVNFTVIDVGAPLIICPAEAITIDLPEDGYVVPNFFENRVSDNCDDLEDLNLVQSPSPGSIISSPAEYTINLTATDSNDNTETCVITLILQGEQTSAPSYNCIPEAEISDIRLDENCNPQIPEYTEFIETENFEPDFDQTYEQLTEETYYFTIVIRDDVTGELVGECSFSANLVDLMPPSISCPNDKIERFDSDEGFVIPNYESMASFSDNCGEVTFQQRPEAGEIIYENTTVTLFAFDSRGLGATCSFEIQRQQTNVLNISCQIDQNVTPEEDCSFILPDYRDTATVNLAGATITQTPAEGTIITESTQIKLTASLDGETDDCYFMVNLVDEEDPIASCISGFVVNLNENGNASIEPEDLDNNSTDNCGIVSMALSQLDFTRADIGEVPITLTVRDEAGNMDSCNTTIEVVDSASGEFQCRKNVVLNLDENGEASLSLQDLYTGDASGLNLEASQLNFSCSDLGPAVIQLDYSGEQTGSCMINVEVRDEIPPVLITGIVELSLNNAGFAYLEENAVLAEDNCSEELIYRFGKSVFTCKDVRANTVNVEVEDASGNITERNIQVRISGESCDIPENDDIEFLFLYPNPSNGIFTIATPEGMIIESIRVFDSRGRYILEQEYNANARFYRMTIQGVEESVYTLQIFTNKGVIVKRAIIRR